MKKSQIVYASAVVILIVLVAVVAFVAGTSFEGDEIVMPTAIERSGCDARCLQATSISGTNYAIQTEVSATETARPTP